jgi:predicted PolB exonuclease-like 3'-5' exonuclease
VVLSKNDHFHDKTSAVLRYMTKYSEKKSSVIKLSQALKNMEKMFGEDMKKLG